MNKNRKRPIDTEKLTGVNGVRDRKKVLKTEKKKCTCRYLKQ